MIINLLNIFFFLIALLVNQNVCATEKRIITNIESDKLKINKKSLISIFSGNAYLERKNLKINAEKITVYQKENQNIKYIEAYGSPAKLTDINKKGETINASAKIIMYNHNSNLIKLSGNAKLKTGDDFFASQTILYNKKSEEIRAGKIKEVAKEKTSRVKIKFYEENNAKTE